MKRARRAALAHHAGLGLLLVFLLYAADGRVGSEAAPAAEAAAPASAAESVISHWREGPRATARQMIAEYGPPGKATWRALRWTGAGPWAKIIAHRDAWPRIAGARKHDWLEQTVSFRVPVKAEDELHRFDERIEINASAGQLTSLSPDEPTNILLLNLAQEIATGKRDVRSAREFAARTEALARAGKSSVYRERLLFPPQSKRSHAPAMVPSRPAGYTDPKKGGSHE